MYVPQNLLVFIAAYSGSISGMAVAGKVLTDQNPADYAGISTVAGAFAKSFDTEWGLRPTTDLDLSIIEEECEGAFNWRYPNVFQVSATVPATYTGECKALIALVTAAGTYFAGQGIVPPAPGGDNDAVIFDDAVPANLSNIRSKRLQQSPIDNTKTGITNISSDSSGTSAGALADYCTIAGGDRNTADVNSLYGTIGGGWQNSVKGQWGTVCGGFGNQAGSEFDSFGQDAVVCGGAGNKARGWDSAIVGGTQNIIEPTAIQGLICGGQNGSVTQQNGTILNGYFCVASGVFSTVINGSGCIASGSYTTAKGNNTLASRPYQSSEGRYDAAGGTGSGGQSCRMPVSFTSGVSVNSDFTLDDGHAYLVRVSCTIKQIGGLKFAAFERTLLVHAEAGIAVIDQNIPGPNNVALAMGAGYTLTITTDGGNAIVATISGGEDGVNAALLYEWVEANNQL